MSTALRWQPAKFYSITSHAVVNTAFIIFLGDYFLNVSWRSDNKLDDSFGLTALMNFLHAVTTVSTVEWWILYFIYFFFFLNCHRKTLKQLSSNSLVKTIVKQIELLKVLIKIKSFMLNIKYIRPTKLTFYRRMRRRFPKEIFSLLHYEFIP